MQLVCHLVLLCCFVFSAVSGRPVELSWKDCTNPWDKGNLTSVSWVPAHPATGENITATAHGYIKEQVVGGTFEMTLTINNAPIWRHRGPLCGYSHFELPQGLVQVSTDGLTCPAKPGPFKATTSVVISNSSPRGGSIVSFLSKDTHGNNLVCVEMFVVS
eukprot:TRINITY_DN28939_c0_g1_i2.p1 TRINITY_DN28939_c0_g1~~TRINITY_DN28939_c0_g1_i2.p1  ORF type:complete len:160 (+),score=4.29 TRINITY_DN28939_c0_g1_i2:54-533(+)